MFDRKTEHPLLGDEAIPGGLAEIKRRVQAALDAKSRDRNPLREARSRGRIAKAMRWLRKTFAQ
jgi:hypothetical protein